MNDSLVRHIESYDYDELLILRRSLERFRTELLFHASHRNMPLPRQRLALQCGALAGLGSIAFSAPLLVCIATTLVAVALVLRYSSRPANRPDWLRMLVTSLNIPGGGYMEVYRNPEMLPDPYPEETLAYCAAQELMLIQRLLDRLCSATDFQA